MAYRVLILHMGDDWLAGSERSLLDLLAACHDRVTAHIVANSSALLVAAGKMGVAGTHCDLAVVSQYSRPSWDFRGLLRSFAPVIRCVRQFRPDLIHANSLWPNQIAVLAGLYTRVPVVCHIRSPDFRGARALALTRWSDALIGVSDAVSEPHRRMHGRRPVHVIYDPINMGQLADPQSGISLTSMFA